LILSLKSDASAIMRRKKFYEDMHDFLLAILRRSLTRRSIADWVPQYIVLLQYIYI